MREMRPKWAAGEGEGEREGLSCYVARSSQIIALFTAPLALALRSGEEMTSSSLLGKKEKKPRWSEV